MASVSATRKPSPPRNQLLAAMSATDFASLQPHLQPVPMALLKDMERPNRRIETVYFMENGIASVVAVQPDETRVEVGLIGREGMSGIPVVLGGDQSPHSIYIQVAGERGQVLMLLISLLIIRDTIKVPRDFNSRPAPRKATVAPSEGV